MAWYMGRARFRDGTVRYFLVNGIADVIQPRLFATKEEAYDAWRIPQEDAWGWIRDHKDSLAELGEPIDVFMSEDPADTDLFFTSRADRTLNIITGPLTLDAAAWQANEAAKSKGVAAGCVSGHKP